MHCYVYASTQKPDTYLWLARRDALDVLPPSLALMLGELRFVLEVELSGERRLPQEDARVVLEHLQSLGWHVQVPPQEILATAYQATAQGAWGDRRDE
jgi:uncharacterized protein